MRPLAVCLAAMTMLLSCRHDKPSRREPPFDRARFITSIVMASRADADLGVMAAHRGRLPETRQFGAVMHREHGQLAAALGAIAKRGGVAVPNAVEEKKAALKENLAILPGQVFDRSYALAMLQDLNAMMGTFQRAANSGDREIESFVSQQMPMIAAEQKSAAALLEKTGGSPFGFVP